MLEYVKLILEKVSFDKYLFEKELKKAIASIQELDLLEELKAWCYKMFSASYSYILNQCF